MAQAPTVKSAGSEAWVQRIRQAGPRLILINQDSPPWRLLISRPVIIMKSAVRSRLSLAGPAVAVLLVLAASTLSSSAASGTWIGSSGGDWNTGANWSGGAYPAGATETGTNTSASNLTINTTSGGAGALIQQRGAGNLTIGGANSFTLPTSSSAIIFGGSGGVPETSGNLVFTAPVTLSGSFAVTQTDANDTAGRLEFAGTLDSGATGIKVLTVGGRFDGAVRFSSAVSGAAGMRVYFNSSANLGESKALEINVPTLTLNRLELSRSSVADGVVKIRAIGGSRTLAASSGTGVIACIATGANTPVTDLEFDGSSALTIYHTGGGNAFNCPNQVPTNASTTGVFTLWQNNSARTYLNGLVTLTGSTTPWAGITNLLIKGGGAGDFDLGAVFQHPSAPTPSSVTVERAVGTITRFMGDDSYLGKTTVTSGTLLINGWPSGSGAVTVGVAGTLGGAGIISGNVTVNGTLAPGDGLGTLTLGGSLTLPAGAVAQVEINRANSPATGDAVVIGGVFNVTNSTLTVSNRGPALQLGDSFTLFNKPTAGFTVLHLPDLDPGLAWANQLAVDGSIAVVAGPVSDLTCGISNNAVTIGWPASRLGWVLQVQTNQLNIGLQTASNAWFDLPATDSVTFTNFPISLTDPSVFYRLKNVSRRVRVVNNGRFNYTNSTYNAAATGRTVVTADGELLRGANLWCMCFHKSKVDYADTFAAWQTIKDYHLNAVRLALNYENTTNTSAELPVYQWTLPEFLAKIDVWVNWAEQLGLYVILDHHEVGKHTQQWLRDFWTAAAPRYANREHVIYEIANEPVGWNPGDYTTNDIADFLEIYRIIRTNAPQTHVILMSFATPNDSAPPGDMVSKSSLLTGVDWSISSVGVHGYWTSTGANINLLKAGFPTINTEWASYKTNAGPSNYKMDGKLWESEAMERLKISWFNWDAAYRADYVPTVLVPMITNAVTNVPSYQWW